MGNRILRREKLPKCKMWKTLILLFCSCIFILDTCQGQPVNTAQSDDCGIIEESSDDARTQAPWVAGIFARPSSKQKFDYRITGTIIGPSTVLTIFARAYGEPSKKGGKYVIAPSFNYRVAVGMKSNNLDDVDEHSQISEVSYIVPFRGHEPDNHDYHYFIFHLKSPLNFKTPYVRAACIPILAKFFGSHILERIHELRQGGFTIPVTSSGSNGLQVIKLSLADSGYCSDIFRKFYSASPENVYCGNMTSSDNELSCTLHGSAPVIPLFNKRWFIIGITALIPPLKADREWCNRNTVYFYGKLIKAINWIETNLKCGSSNFACGDGDCIPLEKLCDQKAECSANEDEDPIFCRARRPCIYGGKSAECGVYGECIRPEQVCDGVSHCSDRSDENPSNCGGKTKTTTNKVNIPTDRISLDINHSVSNGLRPKCPLLQQSEGVDIRCRNPSTGGRIDCSLAVLGTIANFQCKSYYKPVYRLPTTETKCSEDGTWKPQKPFGCEPECGILSTDESTGLIPFIVGGEQTTKDEAFPWHTAIFYKKHDTYQFICGGSLIEESFILTAAHCVTDPAGVIRAKQNFRIAMGPVRNIWVPSTYDRRNLQSDIALLKLEKPAAFGDDVRPICYFSQGGQGRPNPGDIGKVSGLGFVNDTRVAEHLMYASFPVIFTRECTKALKRVPPLSTFCAGYQNGTSVCQGDSGGGMVFPEQLGTSATRYVLKGIVSHGEVLPGKLCNPNNYAVFTHVDAFADWILQRLDGSLSK